MKLRNLLIIFILIFAVTAFIFCSAEKEGTKAEVQTVKKIKGNTWATLGNLIKRVNQDHQNIRKAFLAKDWDQMYKLYEGFKEMGETVVIETPKRKYFGPAAITDYWKSVSEGAKDLVVEIVDLKFHQIISTEIEMPENYIDAKARVHCAFHIITESNHTVKNQHDYYHIRGCRWGY